MGLIIGIIFIAGIFLSIVAWIVIAIIKKRTEKSQGSLIKSSSYIALNIGLTLLIPIIAFMFFPDTHRTGAPTGEDYERWVIKAGILGASPGIANIISLLIAVFTKNKV